MFLSGDVFYAKKARNRVSPKGAKESWHEITAKGYFISIFLGHLPQGQPSVEDVKIIHQLIGNAGLTTFDDVFDCLGEPQMKKLLEFVEEKYKTAPTSKPKSAKAANKKGVKK